MTYQLFINYLCLTGRYDEAHMLVDLRARWPAFFTCDHELGDCCS